MVVETRKSRFKLVILGATIILIVIVFALAQSHKSNSAKQKIIPTASNSQTVKTVDFAIPEWKVVSKLPVSSSPTEHVQYKINPQQQIVAKFSTQELITLDAKACGIDNSPGGSIYRALGSQPYVSPNGAFTGKNIAKEFASHPINPYKVIGQYYYWYTAPSTTCNSTSNGKQLQTNAEAQVKAIVSHLTKQ